MIAFICLFFPAVISVWIYERLMKCRLAARQWCYHYVLSNLAVNFVCFLVKKVFLHTAGLPLYSLSTDATPDTALKYLIMAVPAAAVFAVLASLLKKHVKLTVEETVDAKN